jgi:DNA-binding NarL/FixJ family response regulator
MTASPGKPVRVLIADDQQVVRDGLSALLGLLPGIEVVGTASDGAEAVRQARVLKPDVVLMDLKMPNCDGVEATRRLARTEPSIPVVVLTTYSDDDSIWAALRAGARGFLTKNASVDEILDAIALVLAGQAQLEPSVQRRLLDAIARGEGLGGPGSAAGARRSGGAAKVNPAAPASRPLSGLTEREAEVLTEIAAGLSNTEIAGKLCISDTTVKTHINHLLAKTGVRDRAQLVVYAFRLGLAQ